MEEFDNVIDVNLLLSKFAFTFVLLVFLIHPKFS